MNALRVIAGPVAAAGFALAGIQVVEAADAADGAALIRAHAARPDAGMLLVQEDFLQAVSAAERQEMMGRASPIIVPFPAPSWAEALVPAESYVLELLRRAIGYRVRLQ